MSKRFIHSINYMRGLCMLGVIAVDSSLKPEYPRKVANLTTVDSLIPTSFDSSEAFIKAALSMQSVIYAADIAHCFDPAIESWAFYAIY